MAQSGSGVVTLEARLGLQKCLGLQKWLELRRTSPQGGKIVAQDVSPG